MFSFFTGRSNRQEYWVSVGLLIAVAFLLTFLHMEAASAAITIMWVITWMRRLHDIGRPGWWALVPVVLIIAVVMAGFALGGDPLVKALVAVQSMNAAYVIPDKLVSLIPLSGLRPSSCSSASRSGWARRRAIAARTASARPRRIFSSAASSVAVGLVVVAGAIGVIAMPDGGALARHLLRHGGALSAVIAAAITVHPLDAAAIIAMAVGGVALAVIGAAFGIAGAALAVGNAGRTHIVV